MPCIGVSEKLTLSRVTMRARSSDAKKKILQNQLSTVDKTWSLGSHIHEDLQRLVAATNTNDNVFSSLLDVNLKATTVETELRRVKATTEGVGKAAVPRSPKTSGCLHKRKVHQFTIYNFYEAPSNKTHFRKALKNSWEFYHFMRFLQFKNSGKAKFQHTTWRCLRSSLSTAHSSLVPPFGSTLGNQDCAPGTSSQSQMEPLKYWLINSDLRDLYKNGL